MASKIILRSILAASLCLLAACATDPGTGAITKGSSGAGAADVPSPTSPAGIPNVDGGIGSSRGSEGLGGTRGSF